MKKRISMGAMVLVLGACVNVDAGAELGEFSAAVADVSDSVDKVVRGEITIQERARREKARRDGRVYYTLTAGCNPEDIVLTAASSGVKQSQQAWCDLVPVDDPSRPRSHAENALLAMSVLEEYVAGLVALSASTEPVDVADSSALLINQTQALLETVETGSGQKGWVFKNTDLVSGAVGFTLAQRKTAIMRKAVGDARVPVEIAVSTVISYLVDPDQARDPIVKAERDLTAAYDVMRKTPGNRAAVARTETAHKVYLQAYAISPAVRLAHVLAAHNALADRMDGPATAAEITTLTNELNTLVELFKASEKE